MVKKNGKKGDKKNQKGEKTMGSKRIKINLRNKKNG